MAVFDPYGKEVQPGTIKSVHYLLENLVIQSPLVVVVELPRCLICNAVGSAWNVLCPLSLVEVCNSCGLVHWQQDMFWCWCVGAEESCRASFCQVQLRHKVSWQY